MKGKYFRSDLIRNEFYLSFPKHKDNIWEKEAKLFYAQNLSIMYLSHVKVKIEAIHFDTSMAKVMLDFLLKMEDMPTLEITWKYSDENMLEAGKEYQELTNPSISWKFVSLL